MTAIWRMAREQPLVFLAAVLLVAFGVAGATTVICFVQAVNSRPPGGTAPASSVVFINAPPANGSDWTSGGASPFDRMECWATRPVVATGKAGAPRAATLHLTTPGLLELIGVTPVSGRLPGAAAQLESGPLEALISHPFAQTLGGPKPLIVGDTVDVDGAAVLVVGIAESNFVGPIGQGSRRSLWVVDRSLGQPETASAGGGTQCESTLGRLREGVTPDSAQHLVQSMTGSGPANGASSILPLAGILGHPPNSTLTNFYLRYGMTIMAAVLILLCVNVSVLYACILVSRRREVAIRLGLGATDIEIGRQLLVEWLVTMGIASSLGVLLYLSIAARIDAATPGLAVRLSLMTCVGVATLTILISVVTGVAPALAVARMSPNEVLRAGVSRVGPRRSLQDRLMVAQVALATPVLIAVCIVVTQGLASRLDDGLDPARRSRLMEMTINWGRAGPGWRASALRVDSIFSALTRSGAIAGAAPLAETRREGQLRGNRGTETVEMRFHVPGRLALEERRFLHGRDVMWADTIESQNPVVVSDRLARQLFGTDDAVGRMIHEDGRRGGPVTYSIVGVMAEPEFAGIGSQTNLLYLEGKVPRSWREYLVQSNGDAEESLPLIQETFTRELPELGISVSTLDERRKESNQSSLWLGVFAWGLAALSSGLAVAGFFAVTGLSVRMRWKEIAIRNALGANDWHLLLEFVLRSVSSTARGVAYAALPVTMVLLFVGSQAAVWIAAASAWVLVGSIIILLTAVASGVAASRVVFMHPAQVLHHD